MADKTGRTKLKRLPKGQRTHVRRLKQAAREAGIVYIQPRGAQRPTKSSKKEEDQEHS